MDDMSEPLCVDTGDRPLTAARQPRYGGTRWGWQYAPIDSPCSCDGPEDGMATCSPRARPGRGAGRATSIVGGAGRGRNAGPDAGNHLHVKRKGVLVHL